MQIPLRVLAQNTTLGSVRQTGSFANRRDRPGEHRVPVGIVGGVDDLVVANDIDHVGDLFFIRITLVLLDFDYDASSVVFAKRMNYYYSSKYVEVVICASVVCWSPQYHSSLEPG